ncbi:hypothetical protein SPACI_023750 [Sporomusa acidovorans DSM 3132]|uniref:Chromosome partition protein Smc n=2 Tax=Sporomusa TaxID=2375 RepID=A0ABZ3J1R9_SPOA4|nr:hypothetical protein SPACI_51910 [Sporomusa acidovorans DSM 3132]SDF86661.1 hypothetical protein SAMN04488499_11084 [Sporomusa acidovorans]
MASEKMDTKQDDQAQDITAILTLLQDLQVYGKKIKKVAYTAENEIEKLDKQIEKVQKGLRKLTTSQAGSKNKKVTKIKEYEIQLRKRQREGFEKVLSQLQEEIQHSQETLTKLKNNMV